MNFISGSYFKSFCRHTVSDYIVSDYTSPRDFNFTYRIKEDIENNFIFVKTELLKDIIERVNDGSIILPENFILLTHNSDINITDSIADQVLVELPKIKSWYAQNMLCDTANVHPLPIGLANPKWEHGRISRFQKVAKQNLDKTEIVYVNFNIATNIHYRKDCLRQLGLKINTVYPDNPSALSHNEFALATQEKYLEDMARSYFTVSPFGNGADCHKTWEAIYMKSIPIVIKTTMSSRFKLMGIPMLILNDWSEYKDLKLSESLYQKTWNNFKPEEMDFKYFISQ